MSPKHKRCFTELNRWLTCMHFLINKKFSCYFIKAYHKEQRQKGTIVKHRKNAGVQLIIGNASVNNKLCFLPTSFYLCVKGRYIIAPKSESYLGSHEMFYLDPFFWLSIRFAWFTLYDMRKHHILYDNVCESAEIKK